MDDDKLSKFTVNDLLKTRDEIDTFLKKIGSDKMSKTKVEKADETDYVPDETVDHGAHEEEGGDESPASVEKEGEFPPEEDEMQDTSPDEEMTAPSQDDAMSRVTEALNDMKTMMAAILEAVAPTAAPAPEVVPDMAPAMEEKSGGGQGFSITIGKEIKKQLAEMGLTKSVKTNKPKVETNHPIQKSTEKFDLKKMNLPWKEIHEMNSKIQDKSGKDHY